MAADGIFRYIFEGCISGRDSAIERRTYHKTADTRFTTVLGKVKISGVSPAAATKIREHLVPNPEVLVRR